MRSPIHVLLMMLLLTMLATAVAGQLGKKKPGERCLGSAGYQWCESKQKCLRRWEEYCEELQGPRKQNAKQ
jgi:hypothetical protein